MSDYCSPPPGPADYEQEAMKILMDSYEAHRPVKVVGLFSGGA